MAINPFDLNTRAQPMTRAQAEAAGVDLGLRQYMLKIYNYMASGLALTGIVAALGAKTPFILNALYAQGPGGVFHPTILAWIVMASPLAFILVLSFGINRMKAATAQLVFWAFSGVMGLSLVHIFLAFTGISIVRVFFITAGTFAAMSLYGYTTKRSLTGWGPILFMGLIGIIIASIVNIFLQSSAMGFVISIVGVLVFVGLTAYDTQKIRNMYSELDDAEMHGKKAIMGALTLYLDFINLFIMLLHLFGSRR